MKTVAGRPRGLVVSISLLLLPLASGANTNQFPNNLVSGTVTFQGEPLAGVSVTAFNTNTNSITQVTTTDANGNYQLQLPAAVSTSGIPSDYHIWALKPGYGFYPSVPPGATGVASVMRADHTGDFMGNGVTDIAIYFTVIHYEAIPTLADRSKPGPPLTGANFTAYDGSNPLVNVPAAMPSGSYAFGEGARRTDVSALQIRFIDNQDGTVTDNMTGLIWLRNAGCFSPANWDSALGQLNALADGACGLADGSLAGQWRLPNINELESLVNVSASNPALTPGNPFTNVSTAIYWSSTSYFGGDEGSPSAWSIRFSDGRYMNDSVTNNKANALNAIWAVKGSGGGAIKLQSTGEYVLFADGDDGHVQSGVSPTFPRWVDKGDGTVADTVTGLVWLKQADCIRQTWTEAVFAVHALASGQCGLTDGSRNGSWRMPSREEMLSLSDRMENNHAAFFSHLYLYPDGTVFQEPIFNDFIENQFYWTQTGDAADATRVWTVFSCDFGVYDTARENVGYTLAVRSAQASERLTREPVRR